jgi:transcriptional regulator with XRE-family HTH domain
MVVPGAKERFNEAYNELKWRHVIEKQEDLAALLGTSRPNISAALKGNPTVLTLKFLNRFYEKFKNIFRKEWLLKGEGDMLVDAPKESQPVIDQSSMVNASLSAYIQLTNRLTDDLKKKEIEMQERLAEKDARIVELKNTIADKDTIIKDREAHIVALERKLSAYATSDLDNYPFSIGVADDGPHPNVSPQQ